MSNLVLKAVVAGFSGACKSLGYKRVTRQRFVHEHPTIGLSREIYLYLSEKAEDVEFDITFLVRSLEWDTLQGIPHAQTGFARDLIQVTSLELEFPDSGPYVTALLVSKSADPDQVREKISSMVCSGEKEILAGITSLDAFADALANYDRRYVMFQGQVRERELKAYQELRQNR